MSDKPLRNFDRFEVGHYYVYTGGKELNWTEPMNAVLNYKIHKCLDVWNKIPFSAKFKDVGGCIWNWESGFDNWVEVESPDAVFEKEDDCLIYDKIYQHWKVAEEPITKSSNGVCKYCGKDTITFFFINQEGSILKLGCRCRNCANSYDLIKSAPFDFRLVVDGDKIGTYRDYDLNIIKQLDKLDALNAKENVPSETPDIQTHSHNSQFFSTGTSIKMSLGAIQKELITFNFDFDFKRNKSWETAKALSEWVEFWTDKRKDVDKKDNVFKKYIRNKKYMKFVKEKK